MNSLLTTNILLLIVVIAILVLSVLVAVLIIHIIGVTRKIKHIVSVFNDDIDKVHSVFDVIKNRIVGIFTNKRVRK